MKLFASCALALGLFVLAHGALAALPSDPCPMSAETPVAVELPHVATALTTGKKLDMLAVGSATLFGPEASLSPGTITSKALGGANGHGTLPTQPSDLAFPVQMVKQIKVMYPGADVRITVRGGRGLLATEMLDLLRKEVASKHYDLVLWQTGTVEAVRNLPPGEFGQTLADGIQAVSDAGADLVLIDPQFSRFLQTNSNLDPYFQALQQAASLPGVVLFHRFDLMRGWANEGGLDLERTSKADRQKAIETLHACLGRSLARLVTSAART